ncbi:hypothetical protein BDK51DRAFT_47814 [Blyttiomyces helicus]|uniref:GON domain-containing protein n=1 Tax=Blyttiomyces helicus TaxID=388810 RepID=A0A4P9VYN1_9FUNG|nr:hypothetical protein BDK51DRAFT_47814 [Blyttiomyces helicus]|eukprot:RKO84864.1 hypothetical protein BDK51DRAFT_47814 [Blyttiomyces helicus]
MTISTFTLTSTFISTDLILSTVYTELINTLTTTTTPTTTAAAVTTTTFTDTSTTTVETTVTPAVTVPPAPPCTVSRASTYISASFFFNSAPYVPGPCATLLASAPTSTDGNYNLTLPGSGVQASVYCFNMSSGNPLEYVNLHSGFSQNVHKDDGVTQLTFMKARLLLTNPAAFFIDLFDLTFAKVTKHARGVTGKSSRWRLTGGVVGNPLSRRCLLEKQTTVPPPAFLPLAMSTSLDRVFPSSIRKSTFGAKTPIIKILAGATTDQCIDGLIPGAIIGPCTESVEAAIASPETHRLPLDFQLPIKPCLEGSWRAERFFLGDEVSPEEVGVGASTPSVAKKIKEEGLETYDGDSALALRERSGDRKGREGGDGEGKEDLHGGCGGVDVRRRRVGSPLSVFFAERMEKWSGTRFPSWKAATAQDHCRAQHRSVGCNLFSLNENRRRKQYSGRRSTYRSLFPLRSAERTIKSGKEIKAGFLRLHNTHLQFPSQSLSAATHVAPPESDQRYSRKSVSDAPVDAPYGTCLGSG